MRPLAVRPIHSDEAHRRPGDRFTDRFGIRRIDLPMLHIRLNIGWRYEAHLMADRQQLARSVTRRRAGIYADQARRQLLEEPDNCAIGSDCMKLKHIRR